jgi:sulfofructose kinase
MNHGSMSKTYDILGLGVTAVDDLLYVAEYPGPDAKAHVRSRERQCGGLTATALVAAARLGSACAYAGVLGEDDLSRFVLDRLAAEGIDTASTRIRPGAQPAYSVIIVDEGRKTRNIFCDLAGAVGADPDWPDEDLIRGAKVLFVDQFGIEGMSRAASIARGAGHAVVADLEDDRHPRFAELLVLVDHLIVPRDFAAKLTGRDDPGRSAEALWSSRRRTIIVTCGAEGCWRVGPEEGGRAVHQPAFSVEAVDTTGCGDVFHGAYASALARGLELPERIRFASAAAALKATRRGGQAGIPDRPAVEAFLRGQ